MRNLVAIGRSASCLFTLVTIHTAWCAQPIKVPMTADHWTITAGEVQFVDHLGAPSIVLKPGNYAQHIRSGQATLNGVTFRNGTIEYDVDAGGGMGAGFGFRRTDDDNFEELYLRPRPKCDEAPDCIQYAPNSHGVLMWDLFPQYQSAAPLHQGEWNHIKLVISGERMNIFVNGNAASQPTLKIGRLEGPGEEGGITLFGPGVFSNLTLTPGAVEHLPSDPEKDPAASDSHYVTNWKVSTFSKLAVDQVPNIADMPASNDAWKPLDAERNGLVNVSRLYGLPVEPPGRALVWLKTTIHSNDEQQKHVSLGWAREIWIFVNGQQVLADKNLYMPKDARKDPDGRISLQNGSLSLPLKPGDNEIAVAIANNFYGWGLMMRFDDLNGVQLAKQ